MSKVSNERPFFLPRARDFPANAVSIIERIELLPGNPYECMIKRRRLAFAEIGTSSSQGISRIASIDAVNDGKDEYAFIRHFPHWAGGALKVLIVHLWHCRSSLQMIHPHPLQACIHEEGVHTTSVHHFPGLRFYKSV